MMTTAIDRVATIAKTRTTTSKILAESLDGIQGKSEVDIRDEALRNLSAHWELYPTGWYDPPPGGVSMLWGEKPFTRLQYKTLRDRTYWPSSGIGFNAETVGSVYISPVDRQTNMIGDIGLTVYAGVNEDIKRHIRACHDAVHAIAEHSTVGERLSNLYAYAMDYFQSQSLKIGWMTTDHDPLQINLGHTIPGSFEGQLDFGRSFEEIRETIRSKRIYINRSESFEIPETSALTVEARLVDLEETMPNTLFHLTVTFVNGKKEICSDFDAIFEQMNMKFMLNNNI